MSSDPSAAPASDETIVLAGNFNALGRAVAPGNGWAWIGSAWSIFRAQPGLWIGMALVLAVIFVVLFLVPFIGALAFSVLFPVFVAGFVVASRTVDQGGEAQFAQLFAGFRQRFGPLVVLGVIGTVISSAIAVVLMLVVGAGAFTVFGSEDALAQLSAAGTALVLGTLLWVALTLPLVMATWFAPPLIIFDGLDALQAMKASFGGCLKNLVPFLIYGIVLLIPAVVASIPLMLGWLVLGPIIAASVYTGYRDIYFEAPAA